MTELRGDEADKSESIANLHYMVDLSLYLEQSAEMLNLE